MTAPSTIERPQVGDPALEEGDPVIAHIVRKDGLTEAYVEGTPLTALCGYVWVPSRDPKDRPLCAICKEIAEAAWGADRTGGIQ